MINFVTIVIDIDYKYMYKLLILKNTVGDKQRFIETPVININSYLYQIVANSYFWWKAVSVEEENKQILRNRKNENVRQLVKKVNGPMSKTWKILTIYTPTKTILLIFTLINEHHGDLVYSAGLKQKMLKYVLIQLEKYDGTASKNTPPKTQVVNTNMTAIKIKMP